MSPLLKIILVAVALAGAPVGYVFYESAVSPYDWVYRGGNAGNWANAGYHGAPGPVLGAGLPVLLAAGGVWLYRRRRNKKAESGAVGQDS